MAHGLKWSASLKIATLAVAATTTTIQSPVVSAPRGCGKIIEAVTKAEPQA